MTDADYMRTWRVQMGRSKSLSIPVTVLHKALADPQELRRHLGPDLCRAIDTAVKTGVTH